VLNNAAKIVKFEVGFRTPALFLNHFLCGTIIVRTF